MSLRDFIFSEKRTDRVIRHLLFWLSWGLYSGFLHAAYPLWKPISSFASNLPYSIGSNFLQLLPQIIIAYSTLYLVVPLFIKERKTLLAILLFLGSWIIASLVNMSMIKSGSISDILSLFLPVDLLRVRDGLPSDLGLPVKLLAIFKGNFTAAGFLVVLRYLKQWYLKEQRNTQLQKENTESQLQLLLTQVHPRFLFHTLNNIHQKTITDSPQGSKMILELKDLLRYILNEGIKPEVPLKRELMMIQDYINLEKIRYGNQLDLRVSIPDNTENLLIAPLMILPFVENSFKHGASTILKSPWITLKIHINGRFLNMKLMNGKETGIQNTQYHSGLGIMNVKKRLDLIYAGKYELTINDEPDIYSTDLKIELSKQKPTEEVSVNRM